MLKFNAVTGRSLQSPMTQPLCLVHNDKLNSTQLTQFSILVRGIW